MTIHERPFRYGEGGRGFAILTLPEQVAEAPVVVLLNAGLLHRSEPYRLNVLAARRLAAIGYLCVRVDLSGKGETPPREELVNRESVALDWKYLCEALDRQFGERTALVMGICSGADNGIRLAASDPRIRGLILMDARAARDSLFVFRHVMFRAARWEQWVGLPATVTRRLRMVVGHSQDKPTLGLRDLPRQDDLQTCLTRLVRDDGRMLMVFTCAEMQFYNQCGQFCRAAAIPGLQSICTEHFWPDAIHLYPLADHRARLLATVEDWARTHWEHFRGSSRPHNTQQ